jgi:hypothetical protein
MHFNLPLLPLNYGANVAARLKAHKQQRLRRGSSPPLIAEIFYFHN